MRTYTTGDISATFYGVINYYSLGEMRYCKGSELVADITTVANGTVVFESGNAADADYVKITYKADANGKLKINLSDWARTKKVYSTIADQVQFTLTHESNTITVQMRVFEGICPDEIIMPKSELLPVAKYRDTAQIIPPSAIYASEQFGTLNLSFEFLGISTIHDALNYSTSTGTTSSVTVDNFVYQPKQAQVPANVTRMSMRLGSVALIWQPTLLDNCDDQCMLIWQSLAGVEKRAIFRVRNRKQNTSERINLLTLGSAYDSRANAAMSFEAYIEDCSRYDYAYYSDIVCSPYVKCLYSAEDIVIYTANANSDELGAEVTTKNVTLPNADTSGNKKRTFAIELNYRRYGGL